MGIRLIKAKDRVFDEMETGIKLCWDVNSSFSSTLGFAVCEIDHGHQVWTITYDEYLYCIEGSFSIETEEAEFVLEPGDGIWLPNGTSLIYKSEGKATFLVNVCPVDAAPTFPLGGSYQE